jgi:hypothetical protein
MAQEIRQIITLGGGALDHDMLFIFAMAKRLQELTGLTTWQRNALKRKFDALDEETRVEITRELGTKFVDSLI